VNEQNLPVFTSVLSVINSENPKKYKRYKQLVLKSSKCINYTEVKRHSANHVVLTLTPEVNIVGINKVFSRISFRAVKRPQKLNLELSFETQSSYQSFSAVKMKLLELNSRRVEISFSWKPDN
jgi:hypothetical protein